ncbi:amidohydrolase [uncultured archaeon]|nr:amidohydrolase [uncultured archaeon]HKJ96599.1 amidohydrolase family protein [Thermoplasmataceae archaeon]
MRIITLEEHYATGALMASQRRNMQQGSSMPIGWDPSKFMNRLLDIGDSRITEMDDAGIDVQVLSSVGVEDIENEEKALELACSSNDYLALAIKKHPARFGGFAILPMSTPQKAADELERTVKEYGFKGAMILGHSRGRYLDDRFFWPVLERAQDLDVPLYLHPAVPPDAVVKASYVGNYSGEVANILAGPGWGWHIDTATHILRIILSGAFDTYPRLQLIIGHLGEALPFMMPRTDHMLPAKITKLKRPVGAYLRENVNYTVSGFNYTASFLDLFLQVGSDRIMFSTDYPIWSMKEAHDFLDRLPISPGDKERIAHSNAERLLQI